MYLCVDFMSGGVTVLLEEYALDGDPRRFALLVTLPIIFCVSLVCLFPSCPSFVFPANHTSQSSSSVSNSSVISLSCTPPVYLFPFSLFLLLDMFFVASAPSRSTTRTPSTTPPSSPSPTQRSTATSPTSPSSSPCTRSPSSSSCMCFPSLFSARKATPLTHINKQRPLRFLH